MAISLEFIDFIVPISIIHEKYPGGWKQCLIDYEYGIGGISGMTSIYLETVLWRLMG